MKIALLGYGKEGKSTEKYFKAHFNAECDIFENFTREEIVKKDFSSYDFVFRSPSVPPLKLKNETSATKFFFDNCPAKIIGVTGTKGKGTTCSLIAAILKSLGKTVHLVGNIGFPALDSLSEIKENDIVVFEMSSFQLWDLKKSPETAVVLRIEADHLNVHDGFKDYVNAKSHIAEFQTPENNLIFFKNNEHSVGIAAKSPGKKFAYPLEKPSETLLELLNSLGVPGEHNKENAEAALLAVSAFLNLSLDAFTNENYAKIKSAFENFRGLPHHLEFVRTLNSVDYYDDSFSASYPSLDVALKAFPDQKIVLIAGGKDRGLDLTPAKQAIFNTKNLEKAILIGETREKLATNEDETKFVLETDFKKAILTAKNLAEAAQTDSSKNPVVLLSPGAASFDMFKDFYDRGDKFKAFVRELK